SLPPECRTALSFRAIHPKGARKPARQTLRTAKDSARRTNPSPYDETNVALPGCQESCIENCPAAPVPNGRVRARIVRRITRSLRLDHHRSSEQYGTARCTCKGSG